MPTITIRVTDTEKADLESAARRSGQTLSEYVRSMLSLRQDRIEEMEARLDRVERYWASKPKYEPIP